MGKYHAILQTYFEIKTQALPSAKFSSICTLAMFITYYNQVHLLRPRSLPHRRTHS